MVAPSPPSFVLFECSSVPATMPAPPTPEGGQPQKGPGKQ